MNSIYRSFQFATSARQLQSPHRNIFNAIDEYQDLCDSDEQINTISQQTEVSCSEFQNKKTVKIKPLNMFKDLISLQRENQEKKLKVKQLQNLNLELKNQFEKFKGHNQQLEVFLKEVEFTFQPERKRNQTSEVLLKAKRTLHQEAKQAQQKMKKMFKNSEASNIQEVKVYISTLENHKQKLKKEISLVKSMVSTRSAQQDFNFIQTKKFEKGCRKVRQALDNEINNFAKKQQRYKIEKMTIKGKVKERNLQSQKRNLKQSTQSYKKMLLQAEGLQYQIGLLRHRIKDKKKENLEYDQLLEKIKMKESNTLRLKKQLREKKKTFQYMHQWSRQLKKQLQDRKSEHAKKKAQYESQINSLTAQYQKFTQIYKASLFEQQVAKRKGPRDQDFLNVVKQPLLGKQVTFEEIKESVRALTFHLLEMDCPTKKFIDSLLTIRETISWQPQKDGKRPKSKKLVIIDINQNLPKDTISLQNLLTNFEMDRIHNLTKNDYVKLARFVIEDGGGKADLKTAASISLVRQIFNKLLLRQIEDKADLKPAAVELSKLLKKKGADIRHDIKFLGGRTDQIDIGSVSKIIGKYCLQPFSCNLFTQFIEFYSWKKRKHIGFTTFEDYQEIVALLKEDQLQNIESVLLEN